MSQFSLYVHKSGLKADSFQFFAHDAPSQIENSMIWYVKKPFE